MARRIVRNAKLSNRTLGKIIEYFVLEVPARRAARHLGIHRHSVERVYTRIRTCIVKECEQRSPVRGEIEVDESYFGGRQKGMRGRGAAKKVPVFGLLKRHGKVYTRIVEDVSRHSLQTIIRKKVARTSTVYSDGFSSYDGLVAYGYKHRRINHDIEFAKGKHNHINGIENFWGFAKTRLKRYYGISRKHFNLYLKEMEFRFNNRNEDLIKKIKAILKKWDQ